MKAFFSKRIMSIPISVILLLIVTVGAVAAFLLQLGIAVNLEASSGINASWQGISCGVEGLGSVTTSTLHGNGSATVAGSGFDNDSEVWVSVALYNQDSPLVVPFSIASPPTALSSHTCIVDGVDDCNGFVYGSGN